jgi:hypothetical protein
MRLNRLAAPALRRCAFLVAVLVPTWSALGQTSVYTGSWTNTTFGSTGPANAVVDVVGNLITFTLDLDGNVFGGSNPTPLVVTGTRNPDGSATFNPVLAHPTYGDVTGGLSSTGGITANGVNVPGPTVSSVSLTGQFVPGSIDFNYVVTFEPGAGGGTANGIIDLNLVPEPGLASVAAGACFVAAGRRGRRPR